MTMCVDWVPCYKDIPGNCVAHELTRKEQPHDVGTPNSLHQKNQQQMTEQNNLQCDEAKLTHSWLMGYFLNEFHKKQQVI